MKKTVFLFFFLFFLAAVLPVPAEENLSAKMKKCIDELSYAYAERYPDLVSKQGTAMLEIEETGDTVRKNKLGALIETYIEEQLEKSIIFYPVDRKNLDEILKEQSLSLSGLIDETTGPEIGEISGISAFFSGSVMEEGENIKVSVRLTDASTAEILGTSSFYLPKKEMIDASLDLQYSYVAPNGIGISTGLNYLIIPPSTFTKSTILQLINDISAKYRVSRAFMVEMGVMLPFISLTDNYYEHPTAFSYGDIQDGLPGTLGNETAGMNAAVQSTSFFHVDAQYTITFSPQFNLGAKLGLLFNGNTTVRLSTEPYKLLEGWDPVSGTVADVIVQEKDGIDLVFDHQQGVRIELTPEVFLTPRLALRAAVGYIWTLPAEIFEVRVGTTHYDASEYFGYDAALMPDGSPWTFDFTSLYGGISVSVFF
ncbi:MAG: hypothetical protein JW760_02625 [Spirochaetales bacterium]|nr:hypothetical protein [Spirochaetales bacterium]